MSSINNKILFIKSNYSLLKYLYPKKISIIINFFLFKLLLIIIANFFILIHFIYFTNKKYKMKYSYNELIKILQNKKDTRLFLKNKTEYYFQKRTNYLREQKMNYDESKIITFQDKINYLIIHESPEYKANLADKIKLHQYSKKILGKDICSPILQIYNNTSEINLDQLPEKFILKCNHGSGMNILCKNRTDFDLEKAKRSLDEWMNINYAFGGAEFQYLFIERKIFSSPYLGDLIDYEVYCFNSQPKFIRVHKQLSEHSHRTLHNYYDLDWNLTDIETNFQEYIRDPNIKIGKPKNLNLMINYAKKLSKDFVFVRVDFYDINNTVYLSELTFSPANTLNKYKNEGQRKYLGSLLDITKINSSLYNN